MTTQNPRGPRPRRVLNPTRLMIYGVLIVAALYYIMPLWIMVMTSLKGMPEIRLGNIFSPPMEITFEAWGKAWNTACTGLQCEGLKVGFWNSVQITIPSVVISIIVASVSGYALSFWKFKGSETYFTILIFGSFIPYQVMLFPLVMICRELGIYGTLSAVILVHTIFGMPILTLLFRNYFATLPEELFKAARVDGAGFWGIFFKVLVPMSTPIFVVAGRCCTTLTVEDSQRESMRLDGLHEQAIPRPLPHDKLVQLHCLALQARFAVDLAGQGHDLARAA